jgi:hypothetical protein
MYTVLRCLGIAALLLAGSCATRIPQTTADAIQEAYLDIDSVQGSRTWRLQNSGAGNQQLATTDFFRETIRAIEEGPTELRDTGIAAMRISGHVSVFQTTSGSEGISANRAYANGTEILIDYVDFDVSASSMGGTVYTSVHEKYRVTVPLGLFRVGEPLVFSMSSIRGSRQHSIPPQAWMGLLMRAFYLVGETPTPNEIIVAEVRLRALLSDEVVADPDLLRRLLGKR